MQIYEGCESTEEVITYMAGFDEQLAVFEANTKVEDRIHVIKVINYSFFFTPPSVSSNHWRCVQKACGDLLDSVVRSSLMAATTDEGPRVIRTNVVKSNRGNEVKQELQSRLSGSSQLNRKKKLIKKKR